MYLLDSEILNQIVNQINIFFSAALCGLSLPVSLSTVPVYVVVML